jgi:hypothetical protein
MKKLYLILLLVIYSLSIFSQTPIANAGTDTLFCGYSGHLNAIPSVENGLWSCNYEEIAILNPDNSNTEITTTILNSNNPGQSYFELIWTETNNDLSDNDTIQVNFARIPSSNIEIIPAKCFGEMFTIAAREDSLQQYNWNFYGGAIDSTSINPLDGEYQNFVYWNSEDTLHSISLISTNHWGCQSPITIDTIYEPQIPNFDVTLFPDTCSLGKGAIVFGDTLGNTSFYWLNSGSGPALGSPITYVQNLNAGDYDIRTSYLTANTNYYSYYLWTFGTANCVDTLTYTIESAFNIEASFSISPVTDIGNLTADNGTVIFVNNTVSDIEDLITIWNFGDNTNFTSSDILIEHTYTVAGCFIPQIKVYTNTIEGCQDSLIYDFCIPIDQGIKKSTEFYTFPNPAPDRFHFQLPYGITAHLEVFDSYGNLILEIDDYNSESISTGSLNSGTYFVRCTQLENTYCSKIIIP